MKQTEHNLIETVQKRIGLLISVIGLIVVITNFAKRLLAVDLLYAISGASVWFVLLVVVPFIFSVFFESQIMKIMQITAFLIMGVANIMDAYSEFYGPGLFLIGWLLMRHYGFIVTRKKLKNAIFLFAIVSLSQLSAFRHSQDGIFAGFNTLWYTLFLISMLVIIWRDTIMNQEKLKKENFTLKTDYKELAAQLAEIEENQQPFNLKKYKITPAEERVIKTLTIYKASNREIAERLDIAEGTVKLHLYNIFNKIGIDNRFDVIELCKYNFA